MRRREYVIVGSKDVYPEIDVHIKPASLEADKIVKDRKSLEWSLAFTEAMNAILVKKGLRVL